MEQPGPNASDQQANLEDQIQVETLQDQDNLEQSKGALTLKPKIRRKRSYKVETKAKIPVTQIPSCFNHKEMLKSILA